MTDITAWDETVDQLVARRIELGMSIRDVCALVHKGSATVWRFEHKTREPSISLVLRYARAVGCALTVEVRTNDPAGKRQSSPETYH